jgi:hypothetical protein
MLVHPVCFLVVVVVLLVLVVLVLVVVVIVIVVIKVVVVPDDIVFDCDANTDRFFFLLPNSSVSADRLSLLVRLLSVTYCMIVLVIIIVIIIIN